MFSVAAAEAVNIFCVAVTAAHCLSNADIGHTRREAKNTTPNASDEHAFGIECDWVVDLRVGRPEQHQENDVHDKSNARNSRTDAEQAAEEHDSRDRNSKSDEILRLLKT